MTKEEKVAATEFLIEKKEETIDFLNDLSSTREDDRISIVQAMEDLNVIDSLFRLMEETPETEE